MGLRRWGADPTTDLSGLPPLAADTFVPATYDRLVTHLHHALSAMMGGWNDSLQRALSTSAGSAHDLERELVQLRAQLGRRLLLARHPSLPEQISTSLWDGACRDIRTIQADLEKATTTSTDRATTARGDGERLLDIVRRNSFAAIVEPGFPLHTLYAPAPAPAAPDGQQEFGALPFTPDAAPVRRRVVID